MTTREPFPLPFKKTLEKDLSIYEQKVCAIIKAQAVKVVSGQTTDFDKEISEAVELIWQDGYGKGLVHMDKMHKKIDAMIEKYKKF